MNILILGSGGREAAIAACLEKEGRTVYALPGNGGIANSIPGSAVDRDAVLAACRKYDISYCVVTPDDPLAAGMVDYLQEHGIPCFGPTARAARIESSKAFAKDLMHRYGIPTAKAMTFSSLDQALAFVRTLKTFPVVIKADGLALGKGVSIVQDLEEAAQMLRAMMEDGRFGSAGRTVVIEEFLTGPEVSVLSFTDGRTIIPMVSSMDHKRACDNDQGPNTGGMGTIAPNPYYTEEVAKECMERIFLPTLSALRKEGCPFRGCLYFGLMLTQDGPKVIEYNARFGDPETQVVLPLLQGDLLEIMTACTDGTLDKVRISFSGEACCCVILASEGYPGRYEKGRPITIDGPLEGQIRIAGALRNGNGDLVTNGGRVLGIVAKAPTLAQAVEAAYRDVEKIHFEGCQFRHDIGRRALEA